MTAFPLRGVIGIVASSGAEIEQAAEHGLRCVEVRADLLLAAGLSIAELMRCLHTARELGLATLFTLRHPDHGGVFTGGEAERAALNSEALEQGADLVDLEWGSDAADTLLARGAPLILSHHDFAAMPGADELAALTGAMQAAAPAAIKVVPTARSLADALCMLDWVAGAPAHTPRIGFAMGRAGACSRILSLAGGAPITYASFGAAVAPGQISLDDLCQRYRAQSLDAATRVYALLGASEQLTSVLDAVNRRLQAQARNAVCVAFEDDDFDPLYAHLDRLHIDGLWLPARHAARALACADLGTQGEHAVSALTVQRNGSRRLVTAHAAALADLPELFAPA